MPQKVDGKPQLLRFYVINCSRGRAWVLTFKQFMDRLERVVDFCRANRFAGK